MICSSNWRECGSPPNELVLRYCHSRQRLTPYNLSCLEKLTLNFTSHHTHGHLSAKGLPWFEHFTELLSEMPWENLNNCWDVMGLSMPNSFLAITLPFLFFFLCSAKCSIVWEYKRCLAVLATCCLNPFRKQLWLWLSRMVFHSIWLDVRYHVDFCFLFLFYTFFVF